MPRYWEKRTTGLVADGGVKTVFSVMCPSRCTLCKLALSQTNGVAVAFTVSLFTSLAAAQAFAAGTLTAEETHRVVPDIPSTAPGKLLKLFTGSDGLYENQEGSPSSRNYRIYMVLQPSGAEVGLTFAMSLGALLSLDGS